MGWRGGELFMAYNLGTEMGGGLKRRHIMAGLSKGGVGSKSRPVAGIVAKIVGTARDVL